MPASPRSTSSLYVDMHALTAEMAEAARLNKWSRVVDLEQRVSSFRSAIDASGASAGIPAADLAQVSQLTREIIEHIAEVNRHAGPWLGAVRKLLAAPTLRRRVDNAYGR